MRSMLEGPDSAGPSTAFHAVPLPIGFADSEDIAFQVFATSAASAPLSSGGAQRKPW